MTFRSSAPLRFAPAFHLVLAGCQGKCWARGQKYSQQLHFGSLATNRSGDLFYGPPRPSEENCSRIESGGKKVEMRAIKVVKKWVLVFVAGVVLAHASDPTAVYARVDKVVLEANPNSVVAVQIWGVFSLAKANDRNDYLPARSRLLVFQTGRQSACFARRMADHTRRWSAPQSEQYWA